MRKRKSNNERKEKKCPLIISLCVTHKSKAKPLPNPYFEVCYRSEYNVSLCWTKLKIDQHHHEKLKFDVGCWNLTLNVAVV